MCVSVYIGEGNGKPVQCSCLENPMDRGAWWATVHGVAWATVHGDMTERLSTAHLCIYICMCI